MSETSHLPRRAVLTAGLAAAGGLDLPVAPVRAEAGAAKPGTPAATGPKSEAPKPLPGYAAWKEADDLIVHSNQTLETRRSALGTSLITDLDQLYVRNNVAPPPESILADPDAWRVEIAGVRAPKTLTVAELKRLGLVTVATGLQCSGNGRKYFQDTLTGEQKISGTPLTVGAAGCVI